MNKELEEVIVRFILNKLGLFKSVNGTSIINNGFLINDRLSIYEESYSKLYGLSSKIADVVINIFCVDLTMPEEDSYYIVLVDLKDLPKYALYCDGDYLKLLCKTKDGNWMKTIPFLQASFLAGMEQLHMSNLSYSKANEHDFDNQDVLNLIRIIDEG